MAYNYQRNCPPCGGRPPYRDPWSRHRRGLADRLIEAIGARHRRGLADRLIRDHGCPPPPGAGRPPHQEQWTDRRRRALADRLTGDHGELREKITDFSLSHVRRRKNRKRMICT